MPGGVFLPGVRLQERVLLPCARLHVLPARAEHVLACVDQPRRVPDRVLVHRVGGQARILAEPRVSERATLSRLTIWDAAALGSCRVPASGSRGDTRRGSDDHQVHPSASEATLTGRTAHTCFTWRRAPRWERPWQRTRMPAPTAGGQSRAFRNDGAVRRRLGLPDELVGEVDDVALDGLGVDEAHRFLVAGLAEEALAGAEHDRVDLQPQLVDQVVLHQRAYELEAGGDDDFPVELLLQLRDS